MEQVTLGLFTAPIDLAGSILGDLAGDTLENAARVVRSLHGSNKPFSAWVRLDSILKDGFFKYFIPLDEACHSTPLLEILDPQGHVVLEMRGLKSCD